MDLSFWEKSLVPPGMGVHTVHTASERRQALHLDLYGTHDLDKVQEAHKVNFRSLGSHQGPYLLGICSDTGGGIQRGANWGPLFLRQAYLKNHPDSFSKVKDIGDIKIIPHLLHDKYLNQKTISACQRSLYKQVCSIPVSPLSITQGFLEDFYRSQPLAKLIALGGDHSVSYPLVRTYLEARKKAGKKVALIHFDAHTDLMDERLGIDLCFATWATHIIPFLDSPSDLYQIGIRSSGKSKEFWESKFGIHQYWNYDLVSGGHQKMVTSILDDLTNKSIDELYISFDIDAIDSQFASATGTPEPNGPSPQVCLDIIKQLTSQFSLGGADIVEVAPLVRALGLEQIDLEVTLKSATDIFKVFIDRMVP